MKIILVLMLCTLSVLADEVVFQGLPSVRVFATPERDDRQKLDSAAAQKAECIIVQRGKKYFWVSRDNAPLNRVDTPQFTFFIHPNGLGFVKVFTGERKAVNAPADYIESFTRGFEVITYWGRVTLAGR